MVSYDQLFDGLSMRCKLLCGRNYKHTQQPVLIHMLDGHPRQMAVKLDIESLMRYIIYYIMV